MEETPTSCTRIAIIGAGATGLAQLANLLSTFARPEVRQRTRLEVIVFELAHEVGGVWLSDTRPKEYASAVNEEGTQAWVYDRNGEHPSPMYSGLRTNLPHDLMQYRSFPFPDGTPTFPDRDIIQRYLEDYATHNDVRRHIRFKHRVDRLYHSEPPTSSEGSRSTDLSTKRRWTIDYTTDDGVGESQSFEYVCVANGHYADPWIPSIPGVGEFGRTILHSKYYLRPEDYAGKRVLVVGSFASGSDIARQIAGMNIGKYDPSGSPLTPPPEEAGSSSSRTAGAPDGPATSHGSMDSRGYTSVHVSSSSDIPHVPDGTAGSWSRYVTYHPRIDHFSRDHVHFVNDQVQGNTRTSGSGCIEVDVVIFATGYHFHLPFCKVADLPWSNTRILNGQVSESERRNGNRGEVGGMKGLGVDELDDLLLFLKDDRSIAFPVLQYQIVPFPLAETQTRLTSLLWAGLLPSFPDHLDVPSNSSNPYFTPAPTPPVYESEEEEQGPPVRKVLEMRKKLVFGAPYEFTYQEYLMRLMAEGDTEEGQVAWWASAEARKIRRADTGLRKRTLGY